jgi:hypothetical protein
MRSISCSETSVSNYQYTLTNITEESRFVTFQFPALDNNNMRDARIYEATGTVVTIQDPERMSGKIYSNKYTTFLRKVICVT